MGLPDFVKIFFALLGVLGLGWFSWNSNFSNSLWSRLGLFCFCLVFFFTIILIAVMMAYVLETELFRDAG